MAVKGTSSHSSKTVMAATISPQQVKLPLDLQLDLEKRQKTDTVYIHDSIQVPITKYVPVVKRTHTTDTLYQVFPMPGPLPSMPVINHASLVREEKPTVLQIGPKPTCVTLTVDGHVVYETGNDIHSTEDLQ